MAAPYIVSKFPISKELKHFEACPSSSPKALTYGKYVCCNKSLCNVCDKVKEEEFKGQKVITSCGDSKQYCNSLDQLFSNYVKPGCTYKKIEYKNSKAERQKEPQRKFYPNSHDTKRDNKIDAFLSNKRIAVSKGKSWSRDIPSETCNSYLKQVEDIQKGIKNLPPKPRKPMLPVDSSALKTKFDFSKTMPSQTFQNRETEKLGKQKEIFCAETKRFRQVSDSDACAIVEVAASPKRFREQPPIILLKKDIEDYDNQSSSRNLTLKLTSSARQMTRSYELQEKILSKITAENNIVTIPALPSEDSKYDSGDLHDLKKRTDGPRKKFLSKAASPSYSVGDTLEKCTLEDKPVLQTLPSTATTGIIDTTSSVHPSLRASLFSNVPPYVRFWSSEHKVENPLPKSVQKILKWKLSTITPIVVRQTVANSGFKLVRSSTDWGGMWGRHMKSLCFKMLRENQKINHIPGTYQIGRKDRLWKNLYRFMAKFGKKEFGFIPKTYVLPQDSKSLKSAFDRAGTKTKWIVKPPASARGSGIKVIHKWNQIPKKVPMIVQKYISNPYLINGNKFDLRLYVLVTSFNPLRIYLYDNGLVRFASVKYSEENATLTNRYMHLTNYSINKLSTSYTQNVDAGACEGHKWTIRSLWQFLEESVDVSRLWENLTELVIKTIISGESLIAQMTKNHLNSRYSAYELFGVDVLLDSSLKPWLLEVNISPSLHSTSPLDIAVKGPLVMDLLNMAGFHIPNLIPSDQADAIGKKLGVNSNLCFDHRMYINGLSSTERLKHSKFCKMEDRELYLDSIIEELTPDDVRHLIVYEDEMTQLGNFQKIFPTPDTHNFFQYLEGGRYYNMLFDAWETKFHHHRKDGIRLLESKCKLQIHLDITDVEPRHSVEHAQIQPCCATCVSLYSNKSECSCALLTQ